MFLLSLLLPILPFLLSLLSTFRPHCLPNMPNSCDVGIGRSREIDKSMDINNLIVRISQLADSLGNDYTLTPHQEKHLRAACAKLSSRMKERTLELEVRKYLLECSQIKNDRCI